MKRVASCLLYLSIASASSAQATKSRPATSPLAPGIALYDAEKLEQAKGILTPLATAGDADAMFYLGRIAIEQSKADEAIGWLEQAIKKNDQSSPYHQWLGSAYVLKLTGANPFTAMSLAPTLKRVMERAVELDSTSVGARVNLTGFYLQAPTMMGGGLEKAREQVAAILRLDPFQGRLQEAVIAQNQKDTVATEVTLRDLAKSFPDSAQPVVQLALFYTGLKRYGDAFTLLEDRLKRKPDDASSLYQLGRLGAVSATHLDRAQWALRRYLKIPHRRGMQSIAAAHWRLGMVLEAKGDKKTAKSEYETALRLDPNLAGAKASLDKLK